MAGLDPAIHDLLLLQGREVVDGRDKPGDDDRGCCAGVHHLIIPDSIFKQPLPFSHA
ncbi:hypothetical protein HNQ36_002727 [Afipia massiliensis]|uniref:Uncharacterized protein n=1 Tax=Afipia massiliensis TaxID=211460 RepID=A0A840MXZ8_9BRAD|nr:hypothetical protein [Afipia massiliensis]